MRPDRFRDDQDFPGHITKVHELIDTQQPGIYLLVVTGAEGVVTQYSLYIGSDWKQIEAASDYYVQLLRRTQQGTISQRAQNHEFRWGWQRLRKFVG